MGEAYEQFDKLKNAKTREEQAAAIVSTCDKAVEFKVIGPIEELKQLQERGQQGLKELRDENNNALKEQGEQRKRDMKEQEEQRKKELEELKKELKEQVKEHGEQRKKEINQLIAGALLLLAVLLPSDYLRQSALWQLVSKLVKV